MLGSLGHCKAWGCASSSEKGLHPALLGLFMLEEGHELGSSVLAVDAPGLHAGAEGGEQGRGLGVGIHSSCKCVCVCVCARACVLRGAYMCVIYKVLRRVAQSSKLGEPGPHAKELCSPPQSLVSSLMASMTPCQNMAFVIEYEACL